MARDESRWQPPPAGTTNDQKKKVKEWVDRIVKHGVDLIREQPMYNDLLRSCDMVDGKSMIALLGDENDNGVRSLLTTNRLKRIAREETAALSDVRFPDSVWSTDNQAYEKERDMLQKVARGVWYEGGAAGATRKMVQWGLMGGSASLWPTWKRRIPSDPGSVGIYFSALGPLDRIPFMPDEDDEQQTYAMTIIRRVSIPRAHWMFPLFQGQIEAAPAQEWVTKSLIRDRTARNRFMKWNAEVRYTFVRDASINREPVARPMGDARWSYVVPFIGQEIPSENVNHGQRGTRKATVDDCRLYPHMRLITTVSGVPVPVYDDTAYDWHGLFAPSFQFDPWPTQLMSLAAFRDMWDLERARQRTERNMDTKVRAQMKPVFAYDQTMTPSEVMADFDPWDKSGALPVKGGVDAGKAINTILPPDFYKIDPGMASWLEYLSKEEDYYSGVGQATALAKARGAPMQEGSEDLLNNVGPIVRDASFLMEQPMSVVLEMMKYQIIQFMRFRRVVSYVGLDGTSMESFQLSPGQIVPRKMYFEAQNNNESLFDEDERAINFCRSLRLNPAPGYLHGVPQVTRKLLLLQGFRGGVPLGWRHVLKEVFGIENADEQMRQYQELMSIKVEVGAGIQKEAAALGIHEPTPSGSHKGSGGRPPSGHKPPQAKTKGSAEGPRATIQESR